MLGPGRLMALMLILICLSILSVIMESAFLNQSYMVSIQHLTGFTTKSIAGIGIPFVSLDFFTKGIPNLVTWNYAFLDSGWGSILRMIMSAITGICIVWALVQIFYPIIGSLVSALWNTLLAGFRGLVGL